MQALLNSQNPNALYLRLKLSSPPILLKLPYENQGFVEQPELDYL